MTWWESLALQRGWEIRGIPGQGWQLIRGGFTHSKFSTHGEARAHLRELVAGWSRDGRYPTREKK